jgi:hypothetical protein
MGGIAPGITPWRDPAQRNGWENGVIQGKRGHSELFTKTTLNDPVFRQKK